MKKIFIIFILFFTGCWNYKEVNDMAVVTGIGIDKINDIYEITLLIANPQKANDNSSNNTSKMVVYKSEGKSLIEAIKQIDLKSPKEMYLGHISLFVVSDIVASEGLFKITDLLMRYPESRKNFSFIISKDSKAGDVLKIVTPLETFPSENISANIKSSSKLQGSITKLPFSDFIKDIYTLGINPSVNGVSIKGEVENGTSEEALKKTEPETQLVLEPLALFKDDYFIAWSNKEISQGINILKNNLKEMIINIPCNDKYIAYTINNPKTKIIYQNNLNFKVSIKTNAKISEVQCDIDLQNNDVIKKLEKDVEEKIKNIIESTIEKTKHEYKTDVIGFGNAIYIKNPKEFKQYQNWDNTYIKSNISTSVNVFLTTRGSTENSLKGGEK